MNILCYYPTAKRSISIESLLAGFSKQGHRVFLLTWDMPGDLHRVLEAEGVKTFSNHIRKRSSLQFYYSQFIFLLKFIREHQIQVVYSHIQQPNLVAVVAGRFSSARVIICRHHSDCAWLDNNKREQWADKFINHLGKEFIVPSGKVHAQMVHHEGVSESKINLIRYGYDFSRYDQPDLANSAQIKADHPCRMLLVSVARLIPEKRHEVTISVLKNLVEAGLDLKLIIVGEGPEEARLKNLAALQKLESYITFTGYSTRVPDYLQASDVVVHLSLSEASNSLIKEAGLLSRPVIVCSGVGDFDDYIVDGESGFVLPADDPAVELEARLRDLYKNSGELTVGSSLKKKVLEKFSIENILPAYNKFHSS